MNKVGHSIRVGLQKQFAVVKCCWHVFHSNFNMYAYVYHSYESIGISAIILLKLNFSSKFSTQNNVAFHLFWPTLARAISSYMFGYTYTQRTRVFLLREYSEYILHINKFIRYSWRQQTHGTPVLLYLSSNQKVTISLREEWLWCKKICERKRTHTHLICGNCANKTFNFL